VKSWRCTLVVKQWHDFIVEAETKEEAERLSRRYDYGDETLDHGNDEIDFVDVEEIEETE
jgi:hypothetical protein